MNILPIGAYLTMALLLCGCNSLMQASWDTLEASATGPASIELTRTQVDTVPYPQILVTTSTSEGVMAMARQRGDLEFWVASGKQVLMLRDGLVVRTVGLGVSLDGTRFSGESPFKRGLQHVPDGYASTRWIDIYDGYRVGIAVNSRFSTHDIENIRILEKDFALLRVDEQVDAPTLDFHTTNRYWVDPQDGFIMRSEQHLTPQLSLKIVQLRRDRGAAR
ncbi:YjbF family lipoprotein [Pseudomonas frederiksbergensis]|nr:YjbF family lipoprotein [Pseudomonas frederiksbergensis]